MRVLVACEFSGTVRDAFTALGHDAVSCDLLLSEQIGEHIQDDVRNHLHDGWDLLIAHPPCQYLASSGARWWKGKELLQQEAIDFVLTLLMAPIPKIALENPIGRLSTVVCLPDQIIQPWQFGHPEVKATCLWLVGLPCLMPTDIVDGRMPRVHHAAPSPDRWKVRSRTLSGIAQAMAEQWGN